jgi:hypothetical protein
MPKKESERGRSPNCLVLRLLFRPKFPLMLQLYPSLRAKVKRVAGEATYFANWDQKKLISCAHLIPRSSPRRFKYGSSSLQTHSARRPLMPQNSLSQPKFGVEVRVSHARKI